MMIFPNGKPTIARTPEEKSTHRLGITELV